MQKFCCYSRTKSISFIRREIAENFSIAAYTFSTSQGAVESETWPMDKSDPRVQRLYVWGMAEHGALGELKIKAKKMTFVQVNRPVRKNFAYAKVINDFACGYGFTLYAVKTSKGHKLYGSGLNTDGQIGYQDVRIHHPLKIIYNIVPVKIPLKRSKTQVICVSAGRAHSFAVTDSEGTFAFGSNALGQCGRRIVPDENYQKFSGHHRFMDLDGRRITGVVCGQDHTLLLTEDGKVYSCGCGADGQTGVGHYENVTKPTLVEGDIKGERIVKLSSSADTVLALSKNGQVFGWGNCEYNQLLCMDESQQVNVPRALQSISHLGKIKDVASGGTYSMVLTQKGDVYSWGYGILGVGPKTTHSDIPILIPRTLFGINELSEENKVVTSIYSGITTSMAITSVGDLYAWGVNKYGQLGLGSLLDQFFPLRVALGAKTERVSCGADHTMALCKPFI